MVGALTLNGSVMFDNHSELLLDLAGSASYDRLLTNGAVSIAADTVITINLLSGFDYQAGRDYTFNLLQGVTGDYLANVRWQNLDSQWDIFNAAFLDGTLTFQLQQIPEPSAWALLLTGGVLLLGLRCVRALAR